MGTAVESVGWDISMGIANTKLGRMLLKATSSEKSLAPESMEHVAIKIFGSLYEYGDWGILKTEIPDSGKLKSRYPVGKVRNLHKLGETTKTREEFEAWIEELNQGDFKGSKYHVVKNSCIVWATLACHFLGVPYPPNWDKIRAYAKKNNKVANALGASVMSSRKSSED
ncbi:unnamed protein product [Allacma fusca]|uniref:PPPDE domain-containing protein n=1 Tax=Allacma fusca TaxID=39272 RepID=A0A8J2PQT1_9HEXA|nr:unnamed protein product [Allacma fusca]